MPGPVPTINVITELDEHGEQIEPVVEPHGPDSPDTRPTQARTPSLSPSMPVPLLRVPSRASAATSSAPSSAGPLTPTGEYDNLAPFNVPPSPTFSTQSSHFEPHSTLKLRDNHPDATSGKGSLDLLNPTRHIPGRKLSWSSNEGSQEGTEPDHLMTPMTPTTPMTIADTPSDVKKHPEAEGERPALNLAGDHTDPAPFAFNPTHLATVLDPKNPKQLEAWGGSRGILDGLGSDSINGLSANGAEKTDPGSMRSSFPRDDITTVDSGGGDASTAYGSDSGHQPPGGDAHNRYKAFNATLEERQRVYGANVLPVRKSKSLLQLMWLALNDRILVSLISTSLPNAVISHHSTRSYCASRPLYLLPWGYTKI